MGLPECLNCPVCGHQPEWMPSMIKEAEAIGCNLSDHCPEDYFGFDTGYLPDEEAVAKWNAAVLAYGSASTDTEGRER